MFSPNHNDGFLKKITLGAWLTIGCWSLGHAADVKLGGLVFTHYEYVLSDYLSNGIRANDRNAFDVSRVYLNASSKMDDRFDVFVQLETNQSSRDNTANQTYLKQAWVRWSEVYPRASLRFGMVPATWRSFEEGIWKLRFVAKILEDEEGLLSASDRGVLLSGKIPYVAYDALISNGEGTGGRGTTGNETNKYKDYALRMAVSPFQQPGLKGVKINLQVDEGNKGENWPRDRVLSGLSYESTRFNIWGAYYSARDGKSVVTGTDTVKGAGFSFHSIVNLSKGYWVFARVDQWDPNTNTADDAHRRFYYGLGRTLSENIRVSVDQQFVRQEKVTATQKNQNIIFTHVEVKF